MGRHDTYGQITEAVARPLDKDLLSMVSRGMAAQAAHLALFQIQSEPPEVMVAGVAVLFAVMAQRCGLDPQELHQLGRRILREQRAMRRDNDSLQSLRDFAGIRVMGEREVSIA